MKTKLYAIHDKAIKEMIGPDPARTHAEAERKFTRAVNDPQSGFLHSNPDNFSLYHVGDFDTETGLLEPLREPTLIIQAIQAKKEGN